jgi:uncharacterized protein (TIGR03790 family)
MLVRALELPLGRCSTVLAWYLPALLLLAPTTAAAQSANNLLLVINDSSPASVQTGQYYAGKRAVPDDHIVHIRTDPGDSVGRAEYVRAIELPVGAWLSKHSLQDQVLYLVLTKGVPLRVAGTGGLGGTTASVDSELTLLYRKLLGASPPVGGRVANPYFLDDKPVTDARPFTRALFDTYLVTRLDGFTVDDVLKLIDRGLAPSRDGKIVLDEKATIIDRGGDAWLQETADRLRQTDADRVLLEATRAIATTTGPVMGYFSWGSNDPSNQLRRFGLQFANGAIGGMFVSTDGRTFDEPPADWKPSDPNGRGPRFGGGFQSLAGDLIRDGITGLSANVAEPYLDAIVRPQILFPAYLAGFNLAESFYLAMPFLSWQTVIVGDPLCTPFPRQVLSPEQLSPGLDGESGLPALFAERRLAVLTDEGGKPEALKLTLKVDAQIALGNRDEAEKLLERAAALEPRLELRLGEFYDEGGEYDKAIAAYRRLVAAEPANALALNNLAYDLASHRDAVTEALPLAQKAARLSASAAIADTLGWIQHLLGDDRGGLPMIERAVAGVPDSTEILIHAAVVHAALNDLPKARAELAAAGALDPSVNDRADVKALREKIK